MTRKDQIDESLEFIPEGSDKGALSPFEFDVGPFSHSLYILYWSLQNNPLDNLKF